MRDRDEYEADVIYEIWRRGGNPDAVSPDRLEDYRYDGYDEDEAAQVEVQRQRRRAEPEPEEPT